MWQPTLAAIFALWPGPIGIGYLLLKRWGRFLVAFLGLQILGLTIVRILLGQDIGVYFIVAVYLATVLDTWRLAWARYNELKAVQPT